MALYSDAINTDSKWMWSSITTGSISLLFLSGAFWGLSTSMNQRSMVFPSQLITTSQPFIVSTKTNNKNNSTGINPSTPTIRASIKSPTNTHKINRAAKRNSTFAKTPIIVAKNNEIKSLVKKADPVSKTPALAIAKSISNKKLVNTTSIAKPQISTEKVGINMQPSGVAKTKSNITRQTIPQNQLASLNLKANQQTSQSKATDKPTPKAPFKKVDRHIKVKKGDTLLRILRQNGSSASEAQSIINKLKPHLKVNALNIGQPLTITLDRRVNNNSIHPIKLIIPLGFSPNKPDVVLKDRITISYDAKNELKLDLPTTSFSASDIVSITMRPTKPLKAPKFTPAPNSISKKAADSLTQKIASITTTSKATSKSTVGGKTRNVYYRTRSWVKGSFKKTIAAQGVPKDVQDRLIRVYNQTAKSKIIRNGDILEILYDQTESATGKLQKLGKLLYISFKANGRVYTYYRYGGQFYDAKGKSINPATGGIMTYPVPGAKLTSKYGMRRHPVLRRWKMHSGTDFAAPRGTPIYAAASGKIVTAKWQGGAGRYILINHQNGYTSGYMHMTRFAKGMKPGRNVTKGQIIGYVGSTGLVTGNHLHFEVTLNSKKINPMTVVGRGGIGKLTGSGLSKFNREKARIKAHLNRTTAFARVAKK